MKRLFMSKSLFSHLRKRGLVVLLWTPNERSEFEEAKQTGADGVGMIFTCDLMRQQIMTDYPLLLRQWMDKQ